MKIADITSLLEAFAPLHLQEDYDNSGLLTGNADWDCSGVMSTLDVTENVIIEAVRKNCNCIVAHHPVIFRGLKQVTDSGQVGKALIAAVKNDVAIYAAHTNFDNILAGVNGKIADRLGLTNRKALDTKPAANTGTGLTGDINPLSEKEFLELLGDRFNPELVRHTPLLGKTITKVAVCGGSGSLLTANALNAGADAFVTADLKYHDFFEADGRILLCDIGHYESEQFTTDLFIEIILQKFPTFAVLKSEIKTNPVNYFTGKNNRK
jgi:dinuclear metal center YbgI/SA1388 family protein